jgi:hypothetical protein
VILILFFILIFVNPKFASRTAADDAPPRLELRRPPSG